MATGDASPIRAVLFALVANLGIAVCKTLAALYTGSSAMVAEAIHSFADSGNQLLLLQGIRGASRPPDAEHPLGYGKLSFFWSFMVAILLFSVGGMFSIYEGWHKLDRVEPPERVWVAFIVLGVSIALEAVSLHGCLRELNKTRGRRTLWQWLKQARSAELVVVFGEDVAALIGLVLAICFLAVAEVTGQPRFDAFGSIAIGALLIAVAWFVGAKVKALLIGRSADPELVAEIEGQIAADPIIQTVFNVITVQIGPKLMLAAKIRMRDDLPLAEACARINRLEQSLQDRFPEIAWCFVEPDISD